MRTFLISVMSVALLGGAACKSSEKKAESKFEKAQENVKEKSKDVVKDKQDLSRAKTNLAEARADYQTSMNDRLSRIDVRIHELEGRTDQKSMDAVAKLRNQRSELSAKMNAIGTTAEDNWDTFKKDLDSTFDRIEKDIDAAY